MASEGVTRAEIIQQLGVTDHQIRYACSKYGVQCCVAHQNRTPVHSFEVLRALLYTEIAEAQIALDFGVSRQRVSQIKIAARQAGFQFPHRDWKGTQCPSPTEKSTIPKAGGSSATTPASPDAS